jgi:regulator of sigma E protease
MPGLKIGGDGESYTNAEAQKAADEALAMGHKLMFAQNKAELAKIKDGDKIVAVDELDLHDPEKSATYDKYVILYQYIQKKNGQPVVLTLENTKSKSTPPEQQKITLYPDLEWMPGDSQYPTVLGLSPQIVIGEPMPKSAAADAGLRQGDRIISVGERSGPDMDTFRSIVQNSDGKLLNVTVEHAAKVPATGAATTSGSATIEAAMAAQPDAKMIAARKDSKTGKYLLGVPLMQDVETTRLITPARDSEAGSLGLTFKSTISAVDGTAVGSWLDIYAQLRLRHAGDKVKVTFVPAEGTASVTHEFTMAQADVDAVQEHLHFLLGLSLANENKTQVASNAGEAFMMGIDHTKKFILNVYMTLAGLMRRTVDPSNLHGIVGITKVGYDVQERGTVWLWYVLAMVSVNLAVANFLPLPIVDGGLFLLLILEKIRGKPLSLKVQSAIQTVGIVLLAGLFIFVTYNDIGLFRK